MSLLGPKSSPAQAHEKELALFEKWRNLSKAAARVQRMGGRRYNDLSNRALTLQYELQDMSAFGHSLVWGAEGKIRTEQPKAKVAGPPKIDDTIFWERSRGPGDARDLVPMFFKGRLSRNTDEGLRGDVKARPKHLGYGEYTAVYGADAMVNAKGDYIWPNG